MKKEILNKLKEISIKNNILLLVLFGSRANNTNNKDSDWDFAFYSNTNFNYKNYNKLKNKLYDILKTEKLDLVNLNKEDNPILINEIFENGICIYEKNNSNLFEIMKTNAWFNYIDFLPLIKERNKLIKENLNKMVKNEI